MKYLKYEILTQEPIKMSGQNKSDTTEYSFDYIAGTAIRGAIVGAYAKKYNIDLAHNKELKKLLLKEIFFLNAYPSYSHKRTIPSPLCFVSDKKSLTNYKGQAINVKNIYKNYLYEAGDKPCKKEAFVWLEENVVCGVKVEKGFNLHVSVNGAEGNGERAIFRYESIKPGQKFYGLIATDNEEVFDKLVKLINNTTLFLGGSKGSGYGKCYINYIEEVNCEVEFSCKGLNNEFYIYYLSDAIIYDKNGFITDHIDENDLCSALELDNVEYVDGITDSVDITGYNNTWKTNMPQETGIKAGSIFRYKYDGNFTVATNKMNDLMNTGYGQRRQEGFGRVVFIDSLSQTKWQRVNDREDEIVNINLSEDEKKQINDLLSSLYRQKIMRGIDKNIVEEEKTFRRANLKNSQLTTLMELFVIGNTSDPHTTIKNIKEHFENMSKKMNNQNAIRQFEDAKLCSKSLKDFITDFTDGIYDIDKFISQDTYKPIKLQNGYEYKPTSDEVYIYNLEYIEKLIKYILRNNEKGEGK